MIAHYCTIRCAAGIKSQLLFLCLRQCRLAGSKMFSIVVRPNLRYQTCEHDVLKGNGHKCMVHGARGKGIKRSNLGLEVKGQTHLRPKLYLDTRVSFSTRSVE